MGDLLSKVIPLSLGAAMSPTVLALALVVLAGKRAVARGAAFVVGVITVLGGLTALGLLGAHHATKSSSADEITSVVDGLAGTLLLLLALGTVLRAYLADPAVPVEEKNPDPTKHAGLLSAFVLGVFIMVTNFSTVLLYLPDMRAISASDVGSSEKALVVLFVFLFVSLPATLPFAFRVFLPGFATRVFAQLHKFISRHQRQIGVAIETLFGVYLVAKALK